MRDGSLDDVIGMWVDRILEEFWGERPGDNEAAVYFALLKHAAYGLAETHARFSPSTDYRCEITAVLEAIRSGLPERADRPIDAADMLAPGQDELDAPALDSARPLVGEHASYWSSDTWRKDFYTGFSRSFWATKDYAHAAGRRKSDFLWDVAEVWVATAASALVYYAKDDSTRWFETAQMLRHYADLTEADGLRSLPWGRWGRHAKKNHRPKA